MTRIFDIMETRNGAILLALGAQGLEVPAATIPSTLDVIAGMQRTEYTRALVDGITADMHKEYMDGLEKGGSKCIERIITDNGNGTLTFSTQEKFIPWLSDMEKRDREEILRIFAEGEAGGMHPKQQARAIRDFFDGTNHNAETAARTEASKLRNDARFATYGAAGVKYVQYITAGDGQVRPEHAARDGKIYRIEDAPFLGEFNCRCIMIDADLAVDQGAPVEPDGTVTITDDGRYVITKKPEPSTKTGPAVVDHGTRALMRAKEISAQVDRDMEAARKEYQAAKADHDVVYERLREKRAHIFATPQGPVRSRMIDELEEARMRDLMPLQLKVSAANDHLKSFETIKRQSIHNILLNEQAGGLAYNVSKRSTFYKENKAAADEAFDFINRTLAGSKVSQTVKINPIRRGGRASCGFDGTLNLAPGDRVSTIIHEFGHHMEFKDPAVMRSAFDFYEKRTVGETLEALSKVTGNYGYRRSEVTKVDKFLRPYMGKSYTKRDGERYATELVSMGYEMLYTDPAKLALEDPEYFAWIVNVIKGSA